MRETSDGALTFEMLVKPSPNTPHELLDRLRAALCGLQYVFTKNEAEIVNLGEAYMEGIEVGARLVTGSKGSKEDSPKVGFHANL